MRIVICCFLSLAFFANLAPSAKAETDYFPVGVWEKGRGNLTAAETDGFFEGWYGKQLAAMGEKQLWQQRQQDKAVLTIRLLFLPTFSSGTMMRVSFSDDGSAKFTYKALDGQGGYEPGKLWRRFAGDVEMQMTAKIRTQLNQIDALEGKTPTEVVNPNLLCMDGTQTALEFSGGDKYNLISRHECQMKRNDPLRKLIRLLNEVSGDLVFAPDDFADPY